jgi:hypothetical protein
MVDKVHPPQSEQDGNGLPGAERANIGDEAATFIEQIDGLSSSLLLTLKVTTSAREKISETLRTFIEKHGVLVSETGATQSFTIEQQHAAEIENLKKQREHTELALSILPRSFVVSLVTQFDAYLARLIRSLYYAKPELLDTTENVLSFTKLLELKSLDAAREYLLEREIEGILRKGPTDLFIWLENKFNVPLRKEFNGWHTYLELTERSRHFVYHKGAISEQYLSLISDLGVPVHGAARVGDPLPVSPGYFDAAYRALYEISVKLAHILWRKFKPEDLEAADNNLIETTHDLIKEGKYNLAITLLDFAAITLKTFFNEETRRLLIINRAQAYKWNDQENICSLLLSKEDWVGQSDAFQLAVAVLNNNFGLATRIMEKIGPNESQDQAYKEWPLFRDFRKTFEFHKAYDRIFHRRFTKLEELPKRLAAVQPA